MNTAKVVVIGAGSSGIAAATKLLDLGFQQVTILEAEKRIGGRINTIPFADNVVDMGAQWCHGEKGNVVYDLASKANLLESSGHEYKDFEYLRSNKEVVPSTVNKRLTAIVDEAMNNRHASLPSYDGSLGSYLSDKFNEALRKPENSDIDKTLAMEFFENCQKMNSAAEGAHTWNDISGKGYQDYWECEGDQLLNWKDKGYLEFLRLLMKSEESGVELGMLKDRVLLGKSVKQIKWSDSGVEITCDDNDVIQADHVMVTVSLGALKNKHSTLFVPQLPGDKASAIETIGFGSVNKIFIEFPAKFWPDNWGGFNLLWREEDLVDIRGTNRAWLEDVFGFYTVSKQPRVLNGVVLGERARHMETLSDEEVISGCMYLLRRFLPWDVPQHMSVVTSSWYKNDHFRGVYSYRSILAEEQNKKPSNLASPLETSDHKPIVLFAGEATSDHHYSTVHGAVETGWREAERLAKLYEDKPKVESQDA